MVKLTFLIVEAGHTYDVTCSTEELVQIIWMNLQSGIVLIHIEQKGVTP